MEEKTVGEESCMKKVTKQTEKKEKATGFPRKETDTFFRGPCPWTRKYQKMHCRFFFGATFLMLDISMGRRMRNVKQQDLLRDSDFSHWEILAYFQEADFFCLLFRCLTFRLSVCLLHPLPLR